jgi:hypothetical protein
MTFTDKIKQKIWHFIYKFFPVWQKNLLKWGIIWHEKGRQRYHIGWMAPGKTLEELKVHLSSFGFGNHFIAWIDEGQVLSWRKLVDFRHQYHVRFFEDGEIRGHFEFTPEAYPIKHFMEVGEEESKEDFLNFLGNFVTEKKYISHHFSLDITESHKNPAIFLGFPNKG